MRFSFLLYCLLAFGSIQGFQIDRVILSTNDNPLYIEFWPVVARVWQSMGIRPTLALIGGSDCKVDDSLGDVIRFDPIPGVSEALQTQTIRLFLPALFPEEVCLISDIDMIPISKEYFEKGAEGCPDSAFLVYRDKIDDYWSTKYPMCYVAAKGKVFSAVFSVFSKQEIAQRVAHWAGFGYGWNTDELLLKQYVDEWEESGGMVVRLGHGVGNRLDRGSWTFELDSIDIFNYIDCHCPRPYSDYKEAIDPIADAVLNRYLKS